MPERKEHPIIFSGPMVRAILGGRKTQTRRMLKPQPVIDEGGMWHWKDCQWMDGGLGFPVSGIEDHCPYGYVGDRLWVRESCHIYHWDKPRVVHKADYEGKPCRVRTQIESYEVGRWTPAIHMPRWASRITLEITNVSVERLQEIKKDDLLLEGIRSESCNICPHAGGSGCDYCGVIYDGFISLWDSLNAQKGKSSWELNPWVWVIKFRRVA